MLRRPQGNRVLLSTSQMHARSIVAVAMWGGSIVLGRHRHVRHTTQRQMQVRRDCPDRPWPGPLDTLWRIIVTAVTAAKLSTFSIFHSRSFSRMWTGQLVSTVGGALTSLAAGILVYRLTGSALSVGLVATAVATLFVGLIAGVFVDRYDRKRTMLAAGLTEVHPQCAARICPGCRADRQPRGTPQVSTMDVRE